MITHELTTEETRIVIDALDTYDSLARKRLNEVTSDPCASEAIVVAWDRRSQLASNLLQRMMQHLP